MKKWIFILLAVTIVGFILFLYTSFNGNFISKTYAKYLLKNYTAEIYEGETISIDSGGYNFKDNRYFFTYTVHKDGVDWAYSAELGGPFLPNIDTLYTYLNTDSIDGMQSARYSKEGAKYIKTRLTEQGIATDRVEYSIALPQGFYDAERAWTPALDQLIAPDILIEITDDAHTEARFKKEVQAIQQLLSDANFTYAIVYISVMRTYDNAVEQREGYADTFYETLYRTELRPND